MNTNGESPRILVVDDDEKIRTLLTKYLENENLAVSAVDDGKSMDEKLDSEDFDLVVLDLMLPGEDGLSIARRLKANTPLPIIMLSARGEDTDRIIGLEVGADDYLPKPFNPRELLARIRAVLRRQDTAGTPGDSADATEIFRFGDYTMDSAAQRLLRDEREVELTSGEFTLLEILVRHPNRVLSRDQLVDLIKGYDRSPFDRSIDVRVTRLRRKIEDDPSHPVYIRTVWGKGYLFTPQGDKAAP
ncbi:MAG: response regulator [Gammaproteobacteria bacterium]|jgi:two-component system phosphate regulon response regulator OmpR